MLTRFTQLVNSPEQLEAILGPPSELVRKKQLSRLDGHMRTFISLSPFVLLGTTDREGRCDVSPRGDAPGFIRVLEDDLLVLPERPGNRRADSLHNILERPQVGLLVLIPGRGEALRINGRACLVRDEILLAEMAVQGKTPQLAIAVVVEECFLHCARALLRANLWKPDQWGDHSSLACLAQILIDQTDYQGASVEALQAAYEESNKTLY
jgi:PPOX class probable FMN-dependent enzyme